MEIYVFSEQMRLLGVTDVFSSLRWRRKYFEPGEAELHLPATPENVALFAPGNLIHRVDRPEAATIEGVALENDQMTVTARMLSSRLSRSALDKTYTFTAVTAEAAMHTLVAEQGMRTNPLLLDGLAAEGGAAINKQIGRKELLLALKALAKSAGLGFRVRMSPDAGHWYFDTYTGTDRTVGQSTNPHVIFDDDFGNLLKPKYTVNNAKHKNYAIVAGAGEGSARVVTVVDLTNGNPRRELYVDARDLQKADGDTAESYLQKLRQRGTEKLEACQITECFEANAAVTPNFEYLTDWDLGDIVTAANHCWGLSMNKRITEVEEVYEGSTQRVSPVFGTPLPEFLNLGDD